MFSRCVWTPREEVDDRKCQRRSNRENDVPRRAHVHVHRRHHPDSGRRCQTSDISADALNRTRARKPNSGYDLGRDAGCVSKSEPPPETNVNSVAPIATTASVRIPAGFSACRRSKPYRATQEGRQRKPNGHLDLFHDSEEQYFFHDVLLHDQQRARLRCLLNHP